jgi:glycogen debranching enzyme
MTVRLRDEESFSMTGFNTDTLAQTAGTGAVTIVFGSSFCVSGPNGDIAPDRPHGFFFRDTRIVSAFDLLVNDAPVESLSAMLLQPYRAVYVGRAGHTAGRADTPLIVERERRVGTGVREDLVVRNVSGMPVDCTIDFRLQADFADIFEVKEGHPTAKGERTSRPGPDRLVVESTWEGKKRGFVLSAPGATIIHNQVSYQTTVPPHGSWSRTLLFIPTEEGVEIEHSFPTDRPLQESEPALNYVAWHSNIPVSSVEDVALDNIITRSVKDIGSLRIFDPAHPDRAVVAAGAPWFMALFGRDSILASTMALPVNSSLALGTLKTLADAQGSRVDPATEEQPGRILHEVRFGARSGLPLGGGNVYYGTADATPLFVGLLGELSRWGISADELGALLPNAERALEWVLHSGDRDGDGFVEYERMNDHGLINQGWKDSWDGISFANGTLAEAPIALCEVQGYVYKAFLSRALLARSLENGKDVDKWIERASAVKEEFNKRFWLPDRGYFAIALDRDKRPVDACASNMGHCLWSGIIDQDKAGSVVEHLLSPEMFTGWGIRTLASNMSRYNPASYHNGSVWPHDNALIVSGLIRYGYVEEAVRVTLGLLEAAAFFNDRLPELFCGFSREQYPEPVSYPNSCSPQAWAAAAPIYLIKSLLRFEPCVPTNEVWLAPALPRDFGNLRVEQIPLAGARISIEVSEDEVVVSGLPKGLTLHRVPRSVDADLVDLCV